MTRTSVFLILIVGIIITSIGAYFTIFENENFFAKIAPYLGTISIFVAFVSYVFKKEKETKMKKDVLEMKFLPSLGPLINMMKEYNVDDKLIFPIISEESKKIKSENDLISILLETVNRFVKILNVQKEFEIPYVLALTYKSAYLTNANHGQLAEEIHHYISDIKKINCGKKQWDLNVEKINWYTCFSESERLFTTKLDDLLKYIDISQAEEKRQERNEIYGGLTKIMEHLLGKKPRFSKLLKILRKDFPKAEFLKIITSLESDILILSVEGKSDPRDKNTPDEHKTGHDYVREVLGASKINFGKLNNSVYFAFMKDLVMQDDKTIIFDPKSWGKIIEQKAKNLRKDDENRDRKFNFALLKSSLHDFQAYGDDIKKSKIHLNDEMLKNITSDDIQYSTLVEISKLVKKLESLSLQQFINKNIRYIDGIDDEETADKISNYFMNYHKKDSWQITDFVTKNITEKQLTDLGISSEKAGMILKDSSEISKILS